MKKYVIACFFAIIVMLVPCTSAFEMPLSNEDKTELKALINNENDNDQEILNGIITSDGTLDLDEVEKIYENYYLTGDDSVINSDPWGWIVNRLGWIYITMEQVIILYNTGLTLYYEILQGATAFQAFFDSIQAFRTAWQAFKAKPLNLQTISDLISSAIDLFNAAINVIEYTTSNEIKEAFQTFNDQVQYFVDFLNSDPWLEPITIKGNVTGFDESVTISVISDSVTTTGYYELDYTTADAALPWFVHKCVITATYQGKTNTKNRYAFSMGVIEEDYKPSDFTAKSKNIETPIIAKLNLLLKQLSKGIFHIFNDIINTWISYGILAK